ncbi:hypothetical protein BS17DRAFT_266476 [Gyrodon lividus]|nr:hypothetical protein BS17DRAFT_266476 [Gyrodon lividus]
MSLSGLEIAASESQPSAGKRIKSENYHTTRGLGMMNETSDEVAEAGPSGSGTTNGTVHTRRSTAVRPPEGPSRNNVPTSLPASGSSHVTMITLLMSLSVAHLSI